MSQPNQFNQPNIPQEPQQSQPSLQPEIPQKSGLPTWASILIVVLSISVVGLVSYGAYRYFAPQPEPAELPTAGEEEPADQTADWQTKVTSQFSIAYPLDWFWKEGTDEHDFPYSFITNNTDVLSKNQILLENQVRIVVATGPNSAHPDTYVNFSEREANNKVLDAELDYARDRVQIIKDEKTTVNGVQALVYSSKKESKITKVYYLVTRNKTAFLTCEFLSDNFEATIDKIARTFEI